MSDPDVPPQFQTWMEARALTLVPVAAKELLDGAIDLRLELDRTRHELVTLVSRESKTPLGDLLRLREHEADLLFEVHEAATEVITLLRRGGSADDEFRSWRRAVGRYDRRTA